MKLNINNLVAKIENEIIINNISFTFELGKIYLIKGKNGSGKTTLLKSITRLIKSEGEIKIDDEIVSSNKEISFLFQNPNDQFITSTVKDELILASEIIGIEPEKIDDKIIEVLDNMQISHLLNRKFNSLSMGEKQRIAFSIILLQDKKILLLDEPLSMIDEKNANILIDNIKKIKNRKIIIWATHNQFLPKEFDEIILLSEGRINGN